MIEDMLAFIDTETGGLIPGKHGIVEIAAILTNLDMKEISRFEAKTHVDREVTPEAARINGYSKEVWDKEAVPFSQFQQWLKKHIPFGHLALPVGHNVSFDRDMIDLGYYKPTGMFCPLSYHKVDTVAFSVALKAAGLVNVENVKLTTMSKALGIKHEAQHRAMSDCEVSMEIYRRFIEVLKGASASVIEA